MKRFELARVLGEGTTGIVYEAIDRNTNERVAMKVLRSESPSAIARELRALSELRHPNLVYPREVFEEEDGVSYTMELVEGRDPLAYVRTDDDPEEPTLTDVGVTPSRPRTSDEERVRGVVAQLTRALLALHRHGVLHRDVKPSNILVTSDGMLRLLDYGLSVVGTAAYMAPEQAAPGPAADFYAMGVLLFEMLTGELPFRGLACEVLVNKRLFDAPPPRALRRDLPADLDALCQQLLAREPGARPTALQLAATLRL